MTRTAYITTAAYAGQLSNEQTGHDDQAAALAAVEAFHRAGFHHASVMAYDGRGKYTRQGDVHTRAPRKGDRIVGVDVSTAERFTGTVFGNYSAGGRERYQINEVRRGDGYGPSVAGERVVTFEQYDATAVPGIHYDPAALNLDLRPLVATTITINGRTGDGAWKLTASMPIGELRGVPVDELEAADFGGVKGATYLVELRNADDQVIKALEVVAG